MRAVVMFPGLGSEYPDLLARQCADYPPAAARLADWRERLGVPLTDEPSGSPRECERARQMAIHAVNLLAWERHGAAWPDAAVCGHSLGFYAAAVAAGALDADASFAWIDAVFGHAWAQFEHDTDCVYVLTASGALDGPALAAAWGLELLAVNGPGQIVVYGAPETLAAVCAALADRLVRHGPLGTRCPFHSARMAPVCATVAGWASVMWMASPSSYASIRRAGVPSSCMVRSVRPQPRIATPSRGTRVLMVRMTSSQASISRAISGLPLFMRATLRSRSGSAQPSTLVKPRWP